MVAKLRAADQKYLESFEIWCWRKMEKISWIDHVGNEEVNEQRNILHEIRKWKANWIGHILRKNCLLKQVSECLHYDIPHCLQNCIDNIIL